MNITFPVSSVSPPNSPQVRADVQDMQVEYWLGKEQSNVTFLIFTVQSISNIVCCFVVQRTFLVVLLSGINAVSIVIDAGIEERCVQRIVEDLVPHFDCEQVSCIGCYKLLICVANSKLNYVRIGLF